MKDNELIEIAFVFSQRPNQKELQSLFGTLMQRSRQETNTDQFDLAFWDDTSDIQRVKGDSIEAADRFTSHAVSTITIPLSGFRLAVGAEYTGGIIEPVPHLYLSEQIHPFTDSYNTDGDDAIVAQRRQNFVEILAQAADILEPTWGFGRRGGLAIGEDETIEDLATRTKPPLYEYNVFRPETVKAIGREKVLSAPAYYVEELDSGGVFMAVTEPPKQCGHEGQQCEEVADQLGLDLSTPERYH